MSMLDKEHDSYENEPYEVRRDSTGDLDTMLYPLATTADDEVYYDKEMTYAVVGEIGSNFDPRITTVNPVKEIISISHSHDVPVLLDGAQAAPHTRIDVQDIDVDFYVLSAHKMYGPTGIGVLYGKEKWLNAMPPYQGGGEMISHVSFEKTTFNELPYKFEAGTPDYIGTMAFATALDYIENIGIENIAAHEQNLLHYTTGQLMQIDGMRIFGTAHEKSAVISFLVKDIHHYDMGMLLDKLGFATRTGHHCAQPLMQALGVEGVLRASFAVYNTQEEADAFVAAVDRVAKMF